MKKIKRYLQILISIILLYIVLNWIDFKSVISSLKNVDYNFLILSFIALTLDRVLMAYKWNILLKIKNIKISLYEATKIYYMSSFVGLVLPSTIGSDLIRTHLIVKKKNLTSDVLSSILVERFFGIFALFIYILFSLPLLNQIFHNAYINNNLIISITTVAFFFIFVFILTFNKRVIGFTIHILELIQKKKSLSKISFKIQRLVLSYQGYNDKKGTLFIFTLLTLIEIFFGICINYFIALSFHISIGLIYFIAYVPIMMLLVRIPISLNGFGINEGGSTFFLSLVGVSKAIGFSIGLVDHFINIIGILPGALFYIFEKDIKGKILTEKETIFEE